MKGKISDEIRLRHIVDAIAFIEKFSAGKSKKDLYDDFMYRFSVERQLEIIGEAANNLSSDLISQYSNVPWQQIISFRNFIVHEYFGLDLELIWNVIDIHVQAFKLQVENILKQMSAE
jgi:uncharacterized protein with HEPN domain